MKCVLIYIGTLVAGGLGGYILDLIGVPLPWLLGSLLTVAVLSLCGPSLSTPWGSRQAGQFFLGPGIGLKLTLLEALFVADYIGVMVLSALAYICFGLVAAYILQRITRTDIATAYFSSAPGGVAETSIRAERYSGEAGSVAMAPPFHLLYVVMTVPIGLTWNGATGDPIPEISSHAFEGDGFVLWMVIILVLVGLLAIPCAGNDWMLGPLTGTGVLMAININLSGTPNELLNLPRY